MGKFKENRRLDTLVYNLSRISEREGPAEPEEKRLTSYPGKCYLFCFVLFLRMGDEVWKRDSVLFGIRLSGLLWNLFFGFKQPILAYLFMSLGQGT